MCSDISFPESRHILFVVRFPSRDKIFEFYEVAVNLNMKNEKSPFAPYSYAIYAIEALDLSAIIDFFERISINNVINCFNDRLVNFSGKVVKSFGELFGEINFHLYLPMP